MMVISVLNLFRLRFLFINLCTFVQHHLVMLIIWLNFKLFVESIRNDESNKIKSTFHHEYKYNSTLKPIYFLKILLSFIYFYLFSFKQNYKIYIFFTKLEHLFYIITFHCKINKIPL